MRAVTIGELNVPIKALSQFLREKEFQVQHLDHRSSPRTIRHFFKSEMPWLVLIDHNICRSHIFSILEEGRRWGCKVVYLNMNADLALCWRILGYSVKTTLSLPLDQRDFDRFYLELLGRKERMDVFGNSFFDWEMN